MLTLFLQVLEGIFKFERDESGVAGTKDKKSNNVFFKNNFAGCKNLSFKQIISYFRTSVIWFNLIINENFVSPFSTFQSSNLPEIEQAISDRDFVARSNNFVSFGDGSDSASVEITVLPVSYFSHRNEI